MASWDDLEPLVQTKENYDPDPEEVNQYAEYLGLTLPQDQRYLPIVRDGLLAPLPPFWQACETSSGELFFRNKRTREIVEENPLDEIFRRKIQDIRKIEGTYGVIDPINEESALRESSGILKLSQLRRSDLRLSNLLRSEVEQKPSLIERHITEQSQYSQASFPEGKESFKDRLPDWQKRKLLKLGQLASSIELFFPEKQSLLNRLDTPLQHMQPQRNDRIRELLARREEVERKRQALQQMKEDKKAILTLLSNTDG